MRLDEVGKLRKNMRFGRNCDEMRMEYRWGGEGREEGLSRDGISFYSAIP